jgi:hypothetical protein
MISPTYERVKVDLSLAKTRPDGKGSSHSKCASVGGIHYRRMPQKTLRTVTETKYA